MVVLHASYLLVVVVLFIYYPTKAIEVHKRICHNNIECGVEFNDISGHLEKFVHFKAEYILKGSGFDGSAWVTDPDCSYSNDGYLIFVLLGPPDESGLYKLIKHGNEFSVELIVLSESSADVAWSKKTPNYAYITSLVGQKIVVVDLEKKEITKIYDEFDGFQFAGPDGIYADHYGNIYFTDTDYNVNDNADPDTTLDGGNLFRIDVIHDDIYLEAQVEYGYNGITLNNVYGNGKRLVTSNTVDLSDDMYDITDNTQEDVERIYVAEFIRRDDGSLKDRGRYYSITEDLHRFPKKTFLDGMTFDSHGNLYISVIINQTMSKLVVVNYDDCSDTSDGYTKYIGEIVFKEGFAVNAVTLAGDGYFYASLVNFPDFTTGEFVRFKAKGKGKKMYAKKKGKRKKRDKKGKKKKNVFY